MQYSQLPEQVEPSVWRKAKLAVRFGEPLTPSVEEAPKTDGSVGRDDYIKISEEVMRRIADLAEKEN